jgi:hypothetical protein
VWEAYGLQLPSSGWNCQDSRRGKQRARRTHLSPHACVIRHYVSTERQTATESSDKQQCSNTSSEQIQMRLNRHCQLWSDPPHEPVAPRETLLSKEHIALSLSAMHCLQRAVEQQAGMQRSLTEHPLKWLRFLSKQSAQMDHKLPYYQTQFNHPQKWNY